MKHIWKVEIPGGPRKVVTYDLMAGISKEEVVPNADAVYKCERCGASKEGNDRTGYRYWMPDPSGGGFRFIYDNPENCCEQLMRRVLEG